MSVRPSVPWLCRKYLPHNQDQCQGFGVRKLSITAPLQIDRLRQGQQKRMEVSITWVLGTLSLVRNYKAKCTEINGEVPGACLDVDLCSAWPFPPARGAQNSPSPFSHFDNRHKNVLSQTTRPIQTKFGMSYQGNEALSDYALHLDPPR